MGQWINFQEEDYRDIPKRLVGFFKPKIGFTKYSSQSFNVKNKK